MIALWSFWSKPAITFDHDTWLTPFHHMLSWVLSVETAKKHYTETSLVTDDQGADLLITTLGLSFSSISTELNKLYSSDPHWWALGKLYSYRDQTMPFVHIDSDAYLWKALSSSMESAPLLTQNPEYFNVGESWYHPEKFTRIKEAGGWVPEELIWFMSLGPFQKAECCGIFGGNNLDFIHYYADSAIKMITHPKNAELWKELGADNILAEQYLLSAFYEYHKSHPPRRYGRLRMAYLFQNSEEAFSPEPPRKAGYTHLIGGAKKNSDIMRRLEQRVERDHPLLYYRCRRFKKHNAS